jgi:outer membrane protein OmpA-like peptidoglycan-associated protein
MTGRSPTTLLAWLLVGVGFGAALAGCANSVEKAQATTPVIGDPALDSYVVLFESDSSAIDSAGQAVIDQILLDAPPSRSVTISATGHADRAGSEAYNMALSLRRANAVRAALIAGGIASNIITVAARGESEPAVSTARRRKGTAQPPSRNLPAIEAIVFSGSYRTPA